MKSGKLDIQNKNILIGGVVLGLIILAGISYSGLGYYIYAAAPAESQIIKIGHIGPLTGYAAVYGEQERQGIDLAVSEINAKGGINGKKLVVIHEDDQLDLTTATNALNKLITIDKVPAVIGGMTSSEVLAMAPIAENNNVVLMNHMATSNRITSAGDYIFRIQATNALEARELVKLASSLGVTKYSIIYANSDFGTDLENSIRECFAKSGGTVSISEGYNPDATDFRTQLTKIKEANPQAIFLIGLPKDMAMVLKQSKEIGIKSQFLAPDTFNEPQIMELAGNASEGAIFIYPESDSTRWQQFNDRIQGKYGNEATIVTVMAYDATMVLAAAMENGVTGDEIKTRLYRIKDYAGVSGNITFDKNGDSLSRSYVVKIVKGGKFKDYR